MTVDVRLSPGRRDHGPFHPFEAEMKLVEAIGTNMTLALSDEELYIVHQALNEVCNGISLFEFSTRMGAEREEVRELLRSVGDALDEYESIISRRTE
jgi:hypothetical protein